MIENSRISRFARTNARRPHRAFGIRQADRLSHIYVIGKTGTGKTTLIETLFEQDLHAGRGCALIDPHGDLAEEILARHHAQLGNRLIYLDAAKAGQPFGYNPLRRVRDEKIPLAVAGLIETLRKLWPDAWGVRMEHVLRNSLYALIERPDSNLTDILRLYVDKAFRATVVRGIRNEIVRRYWTDEFAGYSDRLRAEAVGPIQNKLGALLTDPRMRAVLVAPQTDIRFRSLLDHGGVFIANLSKGLIGEDAANLLGGLLVSTIGLAALSRAEDPAVSRRPFFLFVDEFQTFTTLSFVSMMAELRKFGVGLTLAHHYLNQLQPELRHAVLGNAGTIISFRVGPEDASILSKEFAPVFDTIDLMRLPNHSIYLKLMIDGSPSMPFSATTLRPDEVA